MTLIPQFKQRPRVIHEPSAQSRTRQLILDAEREAQMVSAFARLLVVSIALALFLVAGGLRLPVAPVVLTYLLFYGVVSVISAVFSRKRFFNPHLSLLFTAIDGASLALLIGFALNVTGTPLTFHAAVPGFIFVFCILILATMRYTVGPILMTALSFAGAWFAITVFLQDDLGGVTTATNPGFFFGSVQNTARWGFFGIAILLSLLAVIRRRRTLEQAITAAERSANLSRYLPDKISSIVAEQGIDALASAKQQRATIVFADIRGFTALSERAEPADIGALLSAFRSIVLAEVGKHDGFVDKFIGDAVMAVFGVPQTDANHEERGLACAIAIREKVAEWSTERQQSNLPAIGVTIGVHSGAVFAGAVGTRDRMEFTVLGDSVNVAARLQECAKDVASGMVVSEALLQRTGRMQSQTAEWSAMAQRGVRGRSGQIALFEYTPSEPGG